MSEFPERPHRATPGELPRVEPKSRSHVAAKATSTASNHSTGGSGATSSRGDLGTFVLFDTSYKTAGLAFCAFAELTLLVPTIDGSAPLSQHITTGLGMAAFLLAAVRWGLTKVAVSPSGLQLRTIFRSFRLSWDQVIDARVAPTSRTGRGIGSASLVQVRLKDGRCIDVDGVANWGSEQKATTVRQAADLINQYVERFKSVH